jgi:hypothetical protein
MRNINSKQFNRCNTVTEKRIQVLFVPLAKKNEHVSVRSVWDYQRNSSCMSKGTHLTSSKYIVRAVLRFSTALNFRSNGIFLISAITYKIRCLLSHCNSAPDICFATIVFK